LDESGKGWTKIPCGRSLDYHELMSTGARGGLDVAQFGLPV
jgi:hypothetical protein